MPKNSKRSKTGGGRGTNGHAVQGTSRSQRGDSNGSRQQIKMSASTSSAYLGGRSDLAQTTQRLSTVKDQSWRYLNQGPHYSRAANTSLMDAERCESRGDHVGMSIAVSNGEFHTGLGAKAWGHVHRPDSFSVVGLGKEPLDESTVESIRADLKERLAEAGVSWPTGEVVLEMKRSVDDLAEVPVEVWAVALHEQKCWAPVVHGESNPPPTEWVDGHIDWMKSDRTEERARSRTLRPSNEPS